MRHDTTWKLTWFWTPTSVWCRQHWWLSEATIPAMGSRETIWCRQASTSDLTSGGSGWVDWGDDLIITPHLLTSSLTCSSNRCLIMYLQTHYIFQSLDWMNQTASVSAIFFFAASACLVELVACLCGRWETQECLSSPLFLRPQVQPADPARQRTMTGPS